MGFKQPSILGFVAALRALSLYISNTSTSIHHPSFISIWKLKPETTTKLEDFGILDLVQQYFLLSFLSIKHSKQSLLDR